jgi:P-type E1-E2 ATPase
MHLPLAPCPAALSIDLLKHVDTVVFDKTGTLTEEVPHVGQIYPCDTYTEHELLQYAASAEHKQPHPIARAIVQAAQERDIRFLEGTQAEYSVGHGIAVVLAGRRIRVGSARFLDAAQISIPTDIQGLQDTSHQQGNSLILVAVDTAVAGAIELHPMVRPEAKAMIQGLSQRGISATYIISGDHDTPTRKLAKELGVTHYFAETLPARKAELLAELQQHGRSVCYVGDGINDAIALKKAEVSISLRGASSVATDTAQVILMDGRLSHVCELFDLARAYERRMQSIFKSSFFFPALGVAGVLFLHLGFVFAICMNQLGFLSGLTTATLPMLQKRPRQRMLKDRCLSVPP